MSILQETTFGELFEISSSKRVLQKDWKTSGIPFYRAREIVKLARDGSVDNDLFISEDLYGKFQKEFGIPKAGDLMVSAVGTLGACYIVKEDDRFYYKDASVLNFSPKRQLCSKYFKHAFSTAKILDQINAVGGSTVGTYTIDRAKKTKISVPPLADQKRIAAILDKADEIRRKRQAAIAKLDQLAQSIFLEMFGELESNFKKLSITTLKEICLRVTDGTHQAPQWQKDGIPFLFISNIVNSEITLETSKYISEETYNDLTKRCPIEIGDVLYTTVGSYGNVAIVKTSEKFCFQRHIAHIKPNRRLVNVVFLAAMLRSATVRKQVDRVARGVAQKTVNLSDLNKLNVFNPPLDLQEEFAARVTKLEQLKASNIAALAKQNNLFASLQHHAFNGQL